MRDQFGRIKDANGNIFGAKDWVEREEHSKCFQMAMEKSGSTLRHFKGKPFHDEMQKLGHSSGRYEECSCCVTAEYSKIKSVWF